MKPSYHSIEARSYGICRVASHNFWVLRNEDDQVISELHGLATDRVTNRFKPIGIFNDRLGFYEFKRADNAPSFISDKQKSVTIFQGYKEEALACWNKAAFQVKELNKKDINYSPFGIFGFPVANSNSAYHLFAHFMGFECCYFSKVLQPGINNKLAFCHLSNSRSKNTI